MNYYNAELDRWFVLGVAGRGDFINVFTRVGSRLDFIRDYSGVVSPITNANTTPTPAEEFTTISYQETTSEDGNHFETTMETSTETTTKKSIPFTCTGKTDGIYPNPASNCSANFYTCSHGKAYLFVSSFNSSQLPLLETINKSNSIYIQACTSGLVYHAEIGVCDYPFNVAGCQKPLIS